MTNRLSLERFPIHLGLGARAVPQPEFTGMEWFAAYADRMSVRPGETIAFKISSMDDAPYSARLVRVISADANPAGPGLVEEPVEADFAGRHKGRFQAVHAGSYGIVEQGVDLGTKGSLSLIATIWPTRPGIGRRVIWPECAIACRLCAAPPTSRCDSLSGPLGRERVGVRWGDNERRVRATVTQHRSPTVFASTTPPHPNPLPP